jgi:hypothetical protein
MMDRDFLAPDDEQLVEDQPQHHSLIERHLMPLDTDVIGLFALLVAVAIVFVAARCR